MSVGWSAWRLDGANLWNRNSTGSRACSENSASNLQEQFQDRPQYARQCAATRLRYGARTWVAVVQLASGWQTYAAFRLLRRSLDGDRISGRLAFDRRRLRDGGIDHS